MALNNNADDYTNGRIGIYFPGNPASLTGQCVSLVKWFLAEMTGVPSPQAARGNAKDYGNSLIAQGHATEVSADNRRRGDIVVWPSDGGGYGHIGILLSGDRIFEENVGLAGSASILVADGQGGSTRVYPSRIDPLYTNWRKGAPRFYRVHTYAEVNPQPTNPTGSNKDMTPNFIRRTYYMIMNATPTQAEVDFHMAKSNPESFVNGFGDSPLWLRISQERDALVNERNAALAARDSAVAERDAANTTAGTSTAKITELSGIISEHEVTIANLNAKIIEKDAEIASLKDATIDTGSSIDRATIGELIGAIIKKVFKTK